MTNSNGRKVDYSHQCRYCQHCVYGDGWWCDEKQSFVKSPCKPNKCGEFVFNEIAADYVETGRVYKPRPASRFVQGKLFDMPTDKQRKVKGVLS